MKIGIRGENLSSAFAAFVASGNGGEFLLDGVDSVEFKLGEETLEVRWLPDTAEVVVLFQAKLVPDVTEVECVYSLFVPPTTEES